MKIIFSFLVFFASMPLFAALDPQKLGEAFEKARLNQTKDTFYYVLSDDPELREKVNELNQSLSHKTYGPYQLVLKGITPGTRFRLYVCNLLGLENPNFLFSGFIDRHGEAWVKDKEETKKLSNIIHFPNNMLPGEPIHSLVVLNDKKTYIAARHIPVPIESYGENGRHITLELFNPNEAIYLAQGENFTPNEEIALCLNSKDEILIKKIQATQNGSFAVLLKGDLLRNTPQQPKFLEISTTEQTKPLTISYDWSFFEEKNQKRIARR